MTTPNPEWTAFWNKTWAMWRAGALSSLAPIFAQVSKGTFEEFLQSSGDVKNGPLAVFLASHPPRPDEFLIGYAHDRQRITMALTSQRVWCLPKASGEYVAFEMADIASFSTRSAWSTFKATIRFKDGSERVLEKLIGAPSDAAIRLAIANAASHGWGNPSPSPPSDAPVVSPPEPPPASPVEQRFLKERAAFIALASALAGLVVAAVSEGTSALLVAGVTAFLLTGLYQTGKTFLGIGGFYEAVPAGGPPREFDWRRLALEPVAFLGVALAVLVMTGFAVVFKNYIWPLMKGD